MLSYAICVIIVYQNNIPKVLVSSIYVRTLCIGVCTRTYVYVRVRTRTYVINNLRWPRIPALTLHTIVHLY